MKLMDGIRGKAKACARRIVLPEGDEPRTVEAAGIVKAEREEAA